MTTTIARLRAADADPQQVVEAVLAEPAAGPVDPFTDVDPARARREAAASAQALAGDDGPVRPLEGAPVAIKDVVDVAGLATRAGSPALHRVADADATAVARLARAGGVVVGKTRQTELGLSPVGLSASEPAPRNPHDPARPCGGSSSGSAAAVAAGLVPVAVGTDGGGSLRIPPALCGVYGLKPTFGAVPADGQAPCGWWSTNTVGPIAGSVADLAAAWAVMADRPAVDLEGEPGGGEPVRVGVDWAWWGGPEVVEGAVDRAARAAVDPLGPVPVTIGHLDLAPSALYATVLPEVAAALHGPRRDGARLGPDVTLALAAAERITAVDHVRAQQVRRALAGELARVLDDVDVLAVPTTPCVAPAVEPGAWASPPLDEGLVRALTRYTALANLTGAPALAAPVGADAAGHPVSLQLIGRPGGEPALLRLAARLERDGRIGGPPAPHRVDVVARAAAGPAAGGDGAPSPRTGHNDPRADPREEPGRA